MEWRLINRIGDDIVNLEKSLEVVKQKGAPNAQQ